MSYKIPDRILSRIPEHFYIAFAGELTSVFGPGIFVKDEDGAYGVFYCSSTSGWAAALKMTCNKLKLNWLWKYYKKLEWYDSDLFDGEIEDLIISKFVEAETNNANSYYLWLIDRKKYLDKN